MLLQCQMPRMGPQSGAQTHGALINDSFLDGEARVPLSCQQLLAIWSSPRFAIAHVRTRLYTEARESLSCCLAGSYREKEGSQAKICHQIWCWAKNRTAPLACAYQEAWTAELKPGWDLKWCFCSTSSAFQVSGCLDRLLRSLSLIGVG